MNKAVNIEMNEAREILITISDSEKKIVIVENNRKINAMDIYDLLDFSIGDTYDYNVISCSSPKDTKVLEKLKELLKKITDQFSDIRLEENDVDMKEDLKRLDSGQ